MASKTNVAPRKEGMLEKEGPETPPDSPLLERSNAAVKVLIRTAKKRGYVTHDQIESLAKEVNSERIEDILAMFNEMGINVVESEEAETEEATEEAREQPEEEESEGELVGATVARQPPSCAERKSASGHCRRRPKGRLRQLWGSAPAPLRACARHYSSCVTLRLRFNLPQPGVSTIRAAPHVQGLGHRAAVMGVVQLGSSPLLV
jgi:sigma-70-like protein